MASQGIIFLFGLPRSPTSLQGGLVQSTLLIVTISHASAIRGLLEGRRYPPLPQTWRRDSSPIHPQMLCTSGRTGRVAGEGAVVLVHEDRVCHASVAFIEALSKLFPKFHMTNISCHTSFRAHDGHISQMSAVTAAGPHHSQCG